MSYLFAPKAEEPTKIEVAEAKEEPVVEETVIVPSAPLAPVAVDVPQKVEVVEVAVSPCTKTISGFSLFITSSKPFKALLVISLNV